MYYVYYTIFQNNNILIHIRRLGDCTRRSISDGVNRAVSARFMALRVTLPANTLWFFSQPSMDAFVATPTLHNESSEINVQLRCLRVRVVCFVRNVNSNT